MQVGKIELTKFVPETRSDKQAVRIAELEAALRNLIDVSAEGDDEMIFKTIVLASHVLAKEWK